MININDFPDEILTHILSFLPIKESFSTTILSKKWQHLCHSLSVLNIDDEGQDNITYWIHFRQFMNAVMSCPCSQYITLKSFHLKCDAKAECSSLNKWIKAAKQRGIEYLNLNLFKVLLIPTTLFCCKTLVVLKLTNMSVAKMYRCSVDLPSLKTLDLHSVSFHDMENLMRLISGCPILENLTTLFVETRAGLTVGGYFKPLSKLIKADIHSFEVPLRAVSNVQFLRVFEV
ncbi:F-box/LRR-repeat protein [Trifolium medium]|uniref:F-box/LRR-repeat protein n=1 Tax=Trifolium medium TaxID=97028 RepID=A0A392ME49_9FABA|nr:F-box/LRR-repeat protein [Trifolium medium]